MKPYLLAAIVALACTGDHASAAAPQSPAIEKILDICESSTVAEAAKKGDTLGWSRMTDAQTATWRTSFLAQNGGTLAHVAWKHGPEAGAEALSFWIATGPNAHQGCSYTPADATALQDALSAYLGKPERIDRNARVTIIQWKHGRHTLMFSQSGTSAELVLAIRN